MRSKEQLIILKKRPIKFFADFGEQIKSLIQKLFINAFINPDERTAYILLSSYYKIIRSWLETSYQNDGLRSEK